MRVLVKIQTLARRKIARKRYFNAMEKQDSAKRDTRYFTREEQFETLSSTRIFKPD